MHRKPESFIRQPNYPGGKKAMDDFIKSNLRYPEEALKNKVEGTVSIDADIDVNGQVVSTKVKHGIGNGCDEEAKRIVSLLQFEKKRYRGLYVMFHRTINIHFRLQGSIKESEEQGEVKIEYQYKQTSEENKNNNYGY